MTNPETRRQRYAPGSTCMVEGCDIPPRTSGMCLTHLMRQRRHGDPGVVLQRGPRPVTPEAEAFIPRLRAVRVELGLTQEQFGLLCGITVETVRRAERGYRVSEGTCRLIVSGVVEARRIKRRYVRRPVPLAS